MERVRGQEKNELGKNQTIIESGIVEQPHTTIKQRCLIVDADMQTSKGHVLVIILFQVEGVTQNRNETNSSQIMVESVL